MTTTDAAERLPTAFVRFKANMTPENVREFRETWDAALAAERRATVERIRAALGKTSEVHEGRVVGYECDEVDAILAALVAKGVEGVSPFIRKTRKVLFDEEFAIALGADRVEWGEPDADGFYTPSLFKDLKPRPILYEGEEERLAAALNVAYWQQGVPDEPLEAWQRDLDNAVEWYISANDLAERIIERLSAGSAEPDEPSGREGR